VLAARLNVRSEPGLQGVVLGQLRQGDRVDVQGRQDGWLQIAYPEAPGGLAWISQAYVAVDGEPAPQPAAVLPAPPAASQLAGTLVFQASSGGPIYLMNADGSGLRRLTAGLDPSLSPDGSQVAFTRWDVPRGLYIMTGEGDAARLLIGENQIKSPTWSPDGTRLAFNQQRGGSEARTFSFPGFGEFTIPADPYWRLGVVGADGNDRENLPDQRHSFNPSWHSQGILYAAKDGLHLTTEGGETRPVYRTIQPVRNPSFSPDGRFIVATMEFHDHWEIIRLNADGSGLVRLTPTRTGEHSVAPAWSPDGRHVVFLTDREGPWTLWVMDAEGGNPRPLAPQALTDVAFRYDFNAERVVDWQ
jgi:TolB protein